MWQAVADGPARLSRLGDGDVCPPRLPAPMAHWDEVDPNYVLTFTYRDPDFRVVAPVIMPGTIIPKKIVSLSDMPEAPKLVINSAPQPEQSAYLVSGLGSR